MRELEDVSRQAFGDERQEAERLRESVLATEVALKVMGCEADEAKVAVAAEAELTCESRSIFVGSSPSRFRSSGGRSADASTSFAGAAGCCPE